MSDPVVDAQPDLRPERVIASPAPDSRLEALHAQYKPLKEAFEQAQQAFKELKAAITAELETEYQGNARPSEAYEIPASAYGPPLTIYYKHSKYMPDSVIREFFPEIWKDFARDKSYSEVRESQQGRRRGR
jgi:hypothetical protein